MGKHKSDSKASVETWGRDVGIKRLNHFSHVPNNASEKTGEHKTRVNGTEK